MNVHTANKRSACDRCREQKLRCPRGDKNNGACARCLRAGATCCTSSSRPLGRPRLKNSNEPTPASRAHPEEQAKGAQMESTPFTNDALAADGTPFWQTMDGQIDMPITTMATGGPEDNRGVESWSQLESTALFNFQLGDNSFMDSFDNLPESSPARGATQPEHQETVMGIDRLSRSNVGVDMAEDDDDNAARPRPNDGSSPTDVLVELTRLNEDIAQQIALLGNYPWKMPEIAAYCTERFHTTEANPMAQALKSTSEFQAVIRKIQSIRASSSATSDEPDSQASPMSDSGISVGSALRQHSLVSSQPQLHEIPQLRMFSVPNMLLVLSSFLQLLQLWNAILGQAYEILRGLTPDMIDSFNAPPDFNVAGLPWMKGRLYAKLIITLVTDQVSGLDRPLGLPARYRLSEKTESCTEGIFSDAEFSGLLQAVMSQVDPGINRTGESLVLSLKEHFKQLRTVLER